jgi:hypothetical protein
MFHADHFHLDSESRSDLGGTGGCACFGEDLGVVLGGSVVCVPINCARTHSYTALQAHTRLQPDLTFLAFLVFLIRSECL